ncbi:hypothetical protein MMC10_001163 [Thelotrema lepadinum]|nr:hypothetical protein [Thelotrema lepadinum]
MGIKNLPEPIGQVRPSKKVKRKMPSTSEQQMPRYAPIPVDKTPTSAQQPQIQVASSAISVDLTGENSSATMTTAVSVPETITKGATLPSDPTNQPDTPPAVLPPHLFFLKEKYSFATMSISTSSKIEQKVRVLIAHLSRFNFLDREVKPGVVALHARSNAASKLISVVEIAKRDIEAQPKSGKWYQYSRVSAELKEIPRNMPTKIKKGQVSGESAAGKTLKDWNGGKERESCTEKSSAGGNPLAIGAAEHKSEDEDDQFETMADPKAVSKSEDSAKLRNVPVLTIYMARVPVPELKAEFRHVEPANNTFGRLTIQ